MLCGHEAKLFQQLILRLATVIHMHHERYSNGTIVTLFTPFLL